MVNILNHLCIIYFYENITIGVFSVHHSLLFDQLRQFNVLIEKWSGGGGGRKRWFEVK